MIYLFIAKFVWIIRLEYSKDDAILFVMEFLCCLLWSSLVIMTHVLEGHRIFHRWLYIAARILVSFETCLDYGLSVRHHVRRSRTIYSISYWNAKQIYFKDLNYCWLARVRVKFLYLNLFCVFWFIKLLFVIIKNHWVPFSFCSRNRIWGLVRDYEIILCTFTLHCKSIELIYLKFLYIFVNSVVIFHHVSVQCR